MVDYVHILGFNIIIIRDLGENGPTSFDNLATQIYPNVRDKVLTTPIPLTRSLLVRGLLDKE